MKRFFACMMVLVLLLLCACVEASPAAPAQTLAPEQTATPAPTPVPDQPRVIAVFGAEDAAAFLAGVTEAAKDSGIAIEPVSGGLSALATYEPAGETVALVYLSGATATLPGTSVPVFVYAAEGQPVASDVPQLRYDATGAPELALENALNYPPHLAPVRLIGLFSSQTSPAYLLWSEATAAGKVFAKEAFFADTSEVALADWLGDVFSRYYPGMLDAVYAETGAFAAAAADVLAGLGRDDLEVFSAGTDAEAADKLSPILVCAVGPNHADAGARCFAEAQKLLAGESAQSGTLPPESFWYAAKP